jgi:dipeptidyl aminopeptidase/acylaminoacyl peptidase
VVTVTGSGAHHRDGNRDAADPYRPFLAIAESLAGRGIATLRLDDRGIGGSGGDAARASGEDTAADVRAALDWLRRRPAIDADALALLGHSYGGVIAPMVAAEDRRLAALVLLGAPARSFRETMRYQHAWRIEHDPAIPPPARPAALAAAMARQAANVARGEEAWRSFIQDRDPLPTLRRVRMPVLILHGETDRAVSPEDATMLERALREAGNLDVTRVLLPQVNHHFQRDPVGAREGYRSLPTQDLDPRVLATLGEWLAATLRGD